MCAHVGIVPLKRLVSQPYHYSDKVKHVWLNDSDTIMHITESDQVTEKQSIPVGDGNAAMLAVENGNRDKMCRGTRHLPMCMPTSVGGTTSRS
jgi:hypothetical protein